jgi:hypothetical protein
MQKREYVKKVFLGKMFVFVIYVTNDGRWLKQESKKFLSIIANTYVSGENKHTAFSNER